MANTWKSAASSSNNFPSPPCSIFGDKKEFTYYAPGAVRIAEKASAPVKGRSHTIETTIDLKGDEAGVIVSCGGMTGGYTMYIKDGKLHFDYNNHFINHFWLQSRFYTESF